MKFTSVQRRGAWAAAVVVAAATVNVIEMAPASAAAGWGAIAYSGNGANGRAWDYPDPAAAKQTAINYCGYTDCEVLTYFTGCGAVAADSRRFQGGHGPTLAAAESSALRQIGTAGAYIDSWVCN